MRCIQGYEAPRSDLRSSGGEDGVVRVFDLMDGTEVGNYQAAEETVNGFDMHPYLPFAATASGAVYLGAPPTHEIGSYGEDSESVVKLVTVRMIWRLRRCSICLSGLSDVCTHYS